jgi:hypothetical protein
MDLAEGRAPVRRLSRPPRSNAPDCPKRSAIVAAVETTPTPPAPHAVSGSTRSSGSVAASSTARRRELEPPHVRHQCVGRWRARLGHVPRRRLEAGVGALAPAVGPARRDGPRRDRSSPAPPDPVSADGRRVRGDLQPPRSRAGPGDRDSRRLQGRDKWDARCAWRAYARS